jgi:tetratricopeptide (TPR) repeat protein
VRSLFERAMAASPNCPHVLTQYATRYYRDLGFFDEAEDLVQQAIRLDPVNPGHRASMAFVLRYQRRFEDALEAAQRAIALAPHHGYANLAAILALLSMGDFKAAERHIRTLEQFLNPDDVLVTNAWGRFYAASGQIERALTYKEDIKHRSVQPGGERFTPLIGWICLMLEEPSEAAYWFGIALDHQISQVLTSRAFAHVLPYNPLKDADFQRFLSRMNLDDESIRTLRGDA